MQSTKVKNIINKDKNKMIKQQYQKVKIVKRSYKNNKIKH